MKAVWAILAIPVQLASCSPHGFNVYDDPYAYPQFEISWNLDSPIAEDQADARLRLDPSSFQQHLIQHDVKPSTDTDTLSSGKDFSEPIISGYESIIRDNQRYLCALPYVAPSEDNTSPTNRTVEEEESDLALATQRGWELLKGMDGSCIYFVSGWWSYSFCYNHGVRQFHPLPSGRNVPLYPPVEDKSVAAYVLGRFEGSEEPAHHEEDEVDDEESLKAEKKTDTPKTKSLGKLEIKGQTRYLVQNLGGGTVCDLTGEERSIEVQFRCDSTSTDRISLIKETSICQYRMVISTPRLCNDVAFHPPRVAAPHLISCQPIMSEESIPNYLEMRASDADVEEKFAESKVATNKIAKAIIDEFKALMDGGKPDPEKAQKGLNFIETSADKLDILPKKKIVAGIEFGGHNILPAGTKLEKGTVVGGGTKDKFVATIARSDGYVADERELAKLHIKYGKELDSIRKEVERVAEGAQWQIDVVETAHGKELRGIIGDPKKAGKKATKKARLDGSEAKKDKDEVVDEDDGYGQDSGPVDDDSAEEAAEDGSEETYKEEL